MQLIETEILDNNLDKLFNLIKLFAGYCLEHGYLRSVHVILFCLSID